MKRYKPLRRKPKRRTFKALTSPTINALQTPVWARNRLAETAPSKSEGAIQAPAVSAEPLVYTGTYVRGLRGVNKSNDIPFTQGED